MGHFASTTKLNYATHPSGEAATPACKSLGAFSGPGLAGNADGCLRFREETRDLGFVKSG